MKESQLPYTDRLLIVLSLGNLVMIPLLVYETIGFLAMAYRGGAYQFCLHFFLSGVLPGILVSAFFAYAFFMRWRFLLLLRLLYAIHTLPLALYVLNQYGAPLYYRNILTTPTLIYTWVDLLLTILMLISSFFLLLEGGRVIKNGGCYMKILFNKGL